jgi:hypothetical protein
VRLPAKDATGASAPRPAVSHAVKAARPHPEFPSDLHGDYPVSRRAARYFVTSVNEATFDSQSQFGASDRPITKARTSQAPRASSGAEARPSAPVVITCSRE